MFPTYIAGICGASASGKTYIVHQLARLLGPDRVTVFSQDDYYLPLEAQQPDTTGRVNFDHPESLNLDLYHQHLQQLRQGLPVQHSTYTFNNPNLASQPYTLAPARLVLVEGIHIFHREETRNLFDLKVFVEADEALMLSRRLLRDTTERSYSEADILFDWKHYVAPMYRQYVQPHRTGCHLIITNNGPLDTALTVLANHLRQVLAPPA